MQIRYVSNNHDLIGHAYLFIMRSSHHGILLNFRDQKISFSSLMKMKRQVARDVFDANTLNGGPFALLEIYLPHLTVHTLKLKTLVVNSFDT